MQWVHQIKPAVPMNMALEKAMLPNAEKVAARIDRLLND